MPALFARFSIRAKLIAAFAALLTTTIGLGVFALGSMAYLDRHAMVIGDNALPSTGLVSKLNKDALQFRVHEARRILSSDNAIVQAAENEMRDRARRYDESRRLFEPLIDNGEERDRIQRADALWAQYQALTTRTLAYLAKNEREAAAALFNGEETTVFTELTKLLREDSDYNEHNGSNATAEAKDAYIWAKWTTISAIGVALTIGIAATFSLIRGISVPITRITEAMRRLADHDLLIVIPGTERKDEIGGMAAAVEVFKTNMLRTDELEAEQQRAREAKDRRQAAMDRHTQDFGTSVSSVMQSLLDSAKVMQRTAEDVGEAARKTLAATSSTVDGANHSARDLSAVASAAEQMAASINEISHQVAHVTAAVQTAVERAASTNGKVASLSEAADRIGDVVQLITTIAGQTNLLALNATIEAARAGDAGKGFAVVAGEVKVLAAQTARATDEIGTQIVAIRNATAEAVGAVRDVGSAIGRVESVATAIAAAVEEQAAATREITSSVQAVSGTTQASTEAMQSVLVIAEGTETSSALARTAAIDVGRTAETLRQEVTDFLTAMSSGDEADRRKFERISGNGLQARLTTKDGRQVNGVIKDISCGGVSILTTADIAIGAEVEVLLPGTNEQVRARVVRQASGNTALCFHHDRVTRAVLDNVLVFVGRAATKAA